MEKVFTISVSGTGIQLSCIFTESHTHTHTHTHSRYLKSSTSHQGNASEKQDGITILLDWIKSKWLVISIISSPPTSDLEQLELLWYMVQSLNNLVDSYKVNNIIDLEIDVVAKEEEVGWTGSLGLIDADYCLWNG